jgi:hypothetical protein
MIGGAGNSTITSSGDTNVVIASGTGNAMITAMTATSITMFGGTGSDSLSSSGGASVVMLGGAGNATMSSSSDTGVLMIGGAGNATLTAISSSTITMFGGSGNDSLSSTGGSSVVMIGGAGNSTLASSGDTSAVLMGGGAGNVSLSATAGTSITMFGGSGNDTLSADGGAGIGMYGLEGDNTYRISNTPISLTINDLATFGQTLASTDGTTQGINTLEFVGFTTGVTLDLSNASQGTTVTTDQAQQVATGVFLSLTGTFQRVIGTSYADDITAGAGGTVIDSNGGDDSLIGGTGSTTLLAGTGNDTFTAGTGGTTIVFGAGAAGDDVIDAGAGPVTLDFSAFGGGVTIDLTSAVEQMIAPGLTLTLISPSHVTEVVGTAHGDNIKGNATGDTFRVGAGDNTFTGGGGRDTYYFTGTKLGDNLIGGSSTGNTLNFFGFGTGIVLDLTKSDPQGIGTTGSVTLSTPSQFGTVIGTPFADTITANATIGATIIGAGGTDALIAGSGGDYIQGYVDQVVYLDFTSSTRPGSHVYTPLEIATVQQGLTATYAAFNYFFTTDLATALQAAAITGGKYATVVFDAAGVVGGASDQLDPGNRHLDGTARVNITGFLGDARGLVPPTSKNIIALTTTIAAHELGHMAGLQHQDAVGDIGAGLYAGIDPTRFFPGYTGPANAIETARDIMASPGSVGSTLLDAAGSTYIGERDAIKLAFNDTGTVLHQGDLTGVTEAVYENDVPKTRTTFTNPDGTALALTALAVPNTLPDSARDYGLVFEVSALAINGSLSKTQEDFYAIQGRADRYMTFQVISNNDTLNARPFLPELILLDAAGNVVSANVHSFESADSTIFDIVLPEDGTYYVGVDALHGLTEGNYQLFVYSFATREGTGGGDSLTAGAGNDTLVGSSGNDSFTLGSGHAVIRGGSGHYSVSPGNYTMFDATPHTTTLNLSSDSPSAPVGSPIAFRAVVTADPAADGTPGNTPTGTVTFFDRTTGTSLGTIALAKTDGGAEASLEVSTLAVETHEIIATYSSDSYSLASHSATLTGTVTSTTGKTAQTISFAGPGVQVYGAAPIHLSATATSGLAVTFTLVSGPATLSAGGVLTITGVGTVVVEASQAGNATFDAAATVTQSFAINRATLTVTATNASRTYGSANPTFSDAILGFVYGEGAGVVRGVADLTTAATADDVVGQYVIHAALGSLAADDYTFAFADGQLTIAQATPTVKVVDASHAYNASAFVATATVAGVDSVYGASLEGASPSLTYYAGGTALGGAPTDVGTYTVVASFAGSTDYAAASAQTTFTIGAAHLTVTADAASKTYGQTFTSFTGGVAGIQGHDTITAAYASSGAGAGADVGTYYISAALSDGGSGKLALDYLVDSDPSDVGTLTVDPEGTTTAIAAPTITYGQHGMVTITVGAADSFGGTPVGSVSLSVDGKATGSGTLSGGTYTFDVGVLRAGNHAFSVAYADPAGNYSASSATGDLLVNKAALTIGAAGVTRVYDGTTSATVTLSDDRVDGDAVTETYTTATFADKNVGTGKAVGVTGISISGADADNYTFNTTATTTADITARTLTFSATGVNKVYDGTTAASVTLADDRIAGDVFADAYSSATFSSNKNVGNGKAVGVTGISITGTDADNYSLTATAANTTADITPRALVVSATGVNKVYDGGTTATVTLSDNRIAGDVLSDAYSSASFSTKGVGNGKAVSVAGISITGTDAGNYTFNTTASTTADITPRALVVSATGVNKVYDGGTATTVTFSDDRISGDSLAEAATTAFADKNVGNGKAVGVSGISISGNDASNYSLTSTTASATANITPRSLTVGATGVDKVYDRTTAATVVLSDNRVSGDVLADSYSSAAFSDKNVGTNKDVGVSGISISGTDAGNYSLTATTANTTANITARALTVSATGVDKVYDGGTAATVTFSDNRIANDKVTEAGTAAFADKNVGTGKAVSVSGIALTGDDAANYASNATASATASITARALVVTATGANKVYDGTTAATVTLSDNRIAGDTLTDSYSSASFSTKGVANGKAVSVAGVSISGTDAGNYTFNTTATTTADITPRALTIAATGVNKVYDGTTAATVTLTDNRVANDVFADSYTSAAFSNKSVGNGKTVGVSGISISGTDAGNYSLTATTANTTANITARALTVSATGVNKVYDGTPTASVTLSDNRVSGDAITDAYSAASFGDKNVGNGKAVSVSGVSITGTDAGNYTFNTTATTTANITARNLTVSATGANKVYDGTTTASVTLSDNRVSGDKLGETYSAAFANKNVGTGKAVNVSGITLTGDDAANYTANATASTTANVTTRSLTVAAAGTNKVYDGTTTATVGLSDNRVSGDAITDAYSAASFGDKKVGNGKTVSVSGISISGTDAGNYSLSATTASTTANITARALSVTATGVNKVYDGTTTASVTLSDNRIANDKLTEAGTATFADKKAGNGKAVGVTGIALTGDDAANYTSNATASTTANITARALTIRAAGVSRVYDGTTAATVNLSDNRVSGDQLTETYTAAFADKKAATGKAVGVTGIALAGSDAANYTFNTTASATADITRRTLTVTATAANKVYDGTTAATVTLSDDRISGDVFTDTYATATFDDASINNNKLVTVTGIHIAGADDGNYTANTTATARANITAALATTTTLASNAANNTSFYGASVTFTATVAAQGATPSGTVTFYDGSAILSTGTLSGGVATFRFSLLTAGTHSIKAVYAANANYLTSTSSTLSQTVLNSFYVLNATASGALSLSGNATLNPDGLVEVDSSSSSALTLSGNAAINAAKIQVVGGVSKSGNATINHTPITGAGVYIADPLSTLAVPSAGTSSGAVTLSGNSTQTINPGTYSQISVTGNAKLTMTAGVYVIAGGGFTVSGNGSVVGSGVMIYNGGGTGGTFTGVTLSGNGSIDLSAATTGPYAGILIFQSRDNSRVMSLSGNAMVLHGGVIYAPAAVLTVSGNASLTGSVVVNQLQLSGNASSTLTNGGESTSYAAGALVSGDLALFVDDTGGVFTAAQLARIDEAIASINAVINPYGASITEVYDAQSAAMILTEATTSACGSAADGVLGCESATGITIVSGWNWYDGADATAVGADQYDFETIVVHELGHSLGLGHSADAGSVMYATLSTGEAKRSLVVADLNVSDSDGGPCGLHAAAPLAPPAVVPPATARGAVGDNAPIAAFPDPSKASNGTASPRSFEQRPALVTMAVAEAFSPFAVTASDGWNREGARDRAIPFAVTSLDTTADPEERTDDLWGDLTLRQSERDAALVAIMAEWSSGDVFAARLSSFQAAGSPPASAITSLPEGFEDRLAALESTLPAGENLEGMTALSASDWLFCRGADLLFDEDADAAEANSAASCSLSD